jgi:hypothetical protein
MANTSWQNKKHRTFPFKGIMAGSYLGNILHGCRQTLGSMDVSS